MKVKDRLYEDPFLLSLCMGLGAISLGYALQINLGTLHPVSLIFLTIALVLALISVIAPSVPWLAKFGNRPLLFILSLGLAFQLGQLLTAPPGIYLELTEPSEYAPFFLGLILAIVCASTLLWQSSWFVTVRVPLLVISYLIIGVWIIKASPNPFIDVYVFQKDSANALLLGDNPYSMTYPNIYGNSQFYGPDISDNNRLNFGFPYPPLSLLLALPGHVLAGDYRYSQLIAIGLSAIFMAYARPGNLGTAAAALFLFTPRSFFVLEQGWTEPYLVMLLSATVFLACRRPRWLAFALGLLLVVKQYMIIALPLAFLLLPQHLPYLRLKEARKLFAVTAAVSVFISLPLALWDLPAFWKDVIVLQLLQPFRPDALSYPAWFSQGGITHLPYMLAFIAAFFALGLSLWRAPRTPAGFSAGVALVYIAFFAFNKQAFCNYYYFVIGAMCCAIAAASCTPCLVISRSVAVD